MRFNFPEIITIVVLKSSRVFFPFNYLKIHWNSLGLWVNFSQNGETDQSRQYLARKKKISLNCKLHSTLKVNSFDYEGNLRLLL